MKSGNFPDRGGGGSGDISFQKKTSNNIFPDFEGVRGVNFFEFKYKKVDKIIKSLMRPRNVAHCKYKGMNQ